MSWTAHFYLYNDESSDTTKSFLDVLDMLKEETCEIEYIETDFANAPSEFIDLYANSTDMIEAKYLDSTIEDWTSLDALNRQYLDGKTVYTAFGPSGIYLFEEDEIASDLYPSLDSCATYTVP